MEKVRLFEEFPEVSTKDWLEKIEADLKGADFNKKLVWHSAEGFDVMPFYRREDLEKLKHIDSLPGEFPFVRGNHPDGNKWLVRQNIVVTDFAEANKKALDILMKGVESLGFIIADPESVSEDNFKQLLKDIHLNSIEISFLTNGKALEILDILKQIVSRENHDPADLRGGIEADPLGRLMLNGTLCVTEEAGFDYLAKLTSAAETLPSLKTINLNASNFRNAGAGVVQELGFAISMAAEYLAQLTSRGVDAGYAASKIRFSFGIGSDYFIEIAKLRAARLLWSALLKGFDPGSAENVRMSIHSVTSEWNKTIFDPYVNMLRTQTEAMSAVIGGTDSLTVEPYDAAFRKPADFSERIARNQQLLLREEAYLDKVADPSAGSYYIEKLTDLIAGAAWKLFVDIESEGGFLEALRKGKIQSIISTSAAEKKKEVATRKRTFVGTNQFPNASESIPSGTDQSIAFREKPSGDDLTVAPVTLVRGAEEFEKIRIETALAAKRPSAFLFPIGNPAMRRARAQFAAGFFGSAGYTVIDNSGFGSVEEGLEIFRKAGAEVLVICSSDEEYMQFAPAIRSVVNDSTIIVIAGNPASAEELKAAGLNHFIHLRSDVPDLLRLFNTKLGINLPTEENRK
jgi:methylmalonyl-CoA mutase